MNNGRTQRMGFHDLEIESVELGRVSELEWNEAEAEVGLRVEVVVVGGSVCGGLHVNHASVRREIGFRRVRERRELLRNRGTLHTAFDLAQELLVTQDAG